MTATDNNRPRSASPISIRSPALAAAQDKLDRLLEPATDVVAYCNKIQAATRREFSDPEKDELRELNNGSQVWFYRRGPDNAPFCPHVIQAFRPQRALLERLADLTYGSEYEINRVEFAVDVLFHKTSQASALGTFACYQAVKPWPGDRDSTFYENSVGIGLHMDSGGKWPNRSQTFYADRPSKLDNRTPCHHHKIIFSHAGRNRARGLGTFTGLLEADLVALFNAQLRLCALVDPDGLNADIDWWISERAATEILMRNERPRRRSLHDNPFNYPTIASHTAAIRLDLAMALFGMSDAELPEEPTQWHRAPLIRLQRLVPSYVRKNRFVPLDVAQLLPRRIVDPMPDPGSPVKSPNSPHPRIS